MFAGADRSKHVVSIILKSVLTVIAAGSVVFCYASTTKTNFIGKWHDNSGRVKIDDLEISPEAIAVGSRLKYSIADSGPFDGGELYKVTAVNMSIDPMGCGPSGKVQYIAVMPISVAPEIGQIGIRVFFYGGTGVPDPATIKDEPGVCEVHPFGRVIVE